MDRTYNVFVDNGLFVLSYYLEKDIEDIDYKDIEDNLDIMCDKVVEYLNCEKYSNFKSMMFQNSVLTQKTETTLLEQLKYFLDNKGKEICEKCGQNHANTLNEIGRSYFPNLTANTFYNFSNNVQGVNICPYCLILTMYSVLNCRVMGGSVTLYNTDSEDFLYDYTLKLQEQNETDVLLNAKKDKNDKLNKTRYIEEMLGANKIYDCYIEIYSFSNSGQSQSIEVINLNNRTVKLLNSIIKTGYLNEFKEMKLMYELMSGRIENTYLYKIYDYNNSELKCSRELFEILNREVNRLDNNTVNIIKNITNKLIDFDTKKLRNILKLTTTFNDYELFLIDVAEEYNNKTNESLYTVEEYLILDNIKKYKQIKNLLLVSLM